MSDIHIGKSPFDEKKGIIKIEVYFHVPNSKENNDFPGITPAVSAAPGTTEPELTALGNGTLCEVVDSKPFPYDGTPKRKQEIKTAILALWQEVATRKQTELDREYPFYGETVERAN